MTRYPVQLRAQWPLHTGHAALFELALPQRALRVLMVDLQSAPLLPRSPSIRQVAAILEDRARAGQRVDLVLGDFNTPARFLGFDTLGRAAGGYRRASLWSGQWRGTWPSVLFFPMFDIDHVFVSTHLGVLGSAFFRGPGSDHRGQRADLRIP
jgi:endonuclease/exonuclease/phosphatase family metal-dependent hydrolase